MAINIAEELGPVAEQAARIVGQQRVPGDFLVVIRGTITPDGKTITDLGWDWWFQSPSRRVPGPGRVSLVADDQG